MRSVHFSQTTPLAPLSPLASQASHKRGSSQLSLRGASPLPLSGPLAPQKAQTNTSFGSAFQLAKGVLILALSVLGYGALTAQNSPESSSEPIEMQAKPASAVGQDTVPQNMIPGLAYYQADSSSVVDGKSLSDFLKDWHNNRGREITSVSELDSLLETSQPVLVDFKTFFDYFHNKEGNRFNGHQGRVKDLVVGSQTPIVLKDEQGNIHVLIGFRRYSEEIAYIDTFNVFEKGVNPYVQKGRSQKNPFSLNK